MITSSLFKSFFEIIVTVKLYHYQVKSGFKHEKCDWFFEHFLDHADQFLETMQGRDEYGRIHVDAKGLDFHIKSLSDENVQQYMTDVGRFLSDYLPTHIENDSELMNIRDELLSDVNQFKYFMKFT